MSELYQKVILDHFKHPRHQGKLAAEDVLVEKLNPSCGDRIRIGLRVEEGRLLDVSCELQACAIAVASASMMATAVQGQPLAFFEALKLDVESLLSGDVDPDPDLGDLAALVSVRSFPVRIPCALLPWKALAEAVTL